MTITIQDRSTPAGVGFRVIDDTANASDMEIAFIGDRVFASWRDADGRWGRPTSVIDPERFGEIPPNEPTTRANRRIGRAWVEAFCAGLGRTTD